MKPFARHGQDAEGKSLRPWTPSVPSDPLLSTKKPLISEKDDSAAKASRLNKSKTVVDKKSKGNIVDMSSFPLVPLHQVSLLTDNLLEEARVEILQITNSLGKKNDRKNDDENKSLVKYAKRQHAAILTEMEQRGIRKRSLLNKSVSLSSPPSSDEKRLDDLLYGSPSKRAGATLRFREKQRSQRKEKAMKKKEQLKKQELWATFQNTGPPPPAHRTPSFSASTREKR
eukprot:g5283.t1